MAQDLPELVPLSSKSLPRGQSLKKAREVDSLMQHIPLLFSNLTPPSHALDIGSGRAHLSHTLASPPLSLKVTAIDNSEVQLAGANKLKAGFQVGEIVHRCADLDRGSLADLLSTWPKEDLDGKNATLVLTLHGCGDLTTNLLKAWTETQDVHEHTLLAIGCCYNMMDVDKNG